MKDKESNQGWFQEFWSEQLEKWSYQSQNHWDYEDWGTHRFREEQPKSQIVMKKEKKRNRLTYYFTIVLDVKGGNFSYCLVFYLNDKSWDIASLFELLLKHDSNN